MPYSANNIHFILKTRFTTRHYMSLFKCSTKKRARRLKIKPSELKWNGNATIRNVMAVANMKWRSFPFMSYCYYYIDSRCTHTEMLVELKKRRERKRSESKRKAKRRRMSKENTEQRENIFRCETQSSHCHFCFVWIWARESERGKLN